MASEPTTDPTDEHTDGQTDTGAAPLDATESPESTAADETMSDQAMSDQGTTGDEDATATDEAAGGRPVRKAAKKTARTPRKRATSPRRRAGRAEPEATESTELTEPTELTSTVEEPREAEAQVGTEAQVEAQVDETSGGDATTDGTHADEPHADQTRAGDVTVDQDGEDDQVDQDGEDDRHGQDDADRQHGDDDAIAAVVPSFGLIFQAPEPVTPRRRRATSAAGAPARTEPTDPASDRRDEAAAPVEEKVDEPRDEASDGGDDSAEGGSRRSRRRGGRGRRGARGGDSDSAGDSAGSTTSDSGAVAPDDDTESTGRSAKRGGRGGRSSGRTSQADTPDDGAGDGGADRASDDAGDDTDADSGSRRRRRRRRGAGEESDESRGARARDEVTGLKGSTRLEAKKQRRREGREAGRRRQIITEAEFLARRESVERVMVVREEEGKTQIGVLEDGVLVEHYVSRETGASMIGNVYLGRVQNVLPSMEAAFVDIGKGRNAVLYAGEVNWDAAGLEGNVPKRIENALTSGDTVLVQVTKDPIGHKGARLTSQVSLPGRFLVYVPEASMTGISRKLPDTERARLKSILKRIVPDDAGVIVRTASEGASEEELTADIERLTKAWERIRTKAEKAAKKKGTAGAPVLLHGEPDLTVKVIRDVFNEDFSGLVVSGERAWEDVSEYLGDVAPDLAKRLSKWTSEIDVFTSHRIDEQLAKALDRKVWLPSGGSLVIDRTEAMTVVDVNTGKFVGSGGNLEETVTKNNIEAAEEIVRQLRLRDIGGIIVIDFIDMVLEANRDLVVRRLLECLGRDRTKHQVAEVTSLGLVQMTRKRVGSGLLEVFSEPCGNCSGRGVVVHADPVDPPAQEESNGGNGRGRGRGRGGSGSGQSSTGRGGRVDSAEPARPQPTGPTAAQIAAAAHAAALKATAAVTEDRDGGAEPDADRIAEIATQVADAVSAEGLVPGDEPSGPAPTDAEPSDGGSAEAAPSDGDRDPVATDIGVTEPAASEPAATEPAGTITEAATAAAAETESTGSADADARPVADPPATRPRRRRGRVIAQAGPPGRSEVRVLGAGDSGDSDDTSQASAPGGATD